MNAFNNVKFVGANMDGTQWQTVLQNGTARHALVSSIWQVIMQI